MKKSTAVTGEGRFNSKTLLSTAGSRARAAYGLCRGECQRSSRRRPAACWQELKDYYCPWESQVALARKNTHTLQSNHLTPKMPARHCNDALGTTIFREENSNSDVSQRELVKNDSCTARRPGAPTAEKHAFCKPAPRSCRTTLPSAAATGPLPPTAPLTCPLQTTDNAGTCLNALAPTELLSHKVFNWHLPTRSHCYFGRTVE